MFDATDFPNAFTVREVFSYGTILPDSLVWVLRVPDWPLFGQLMVPLDGFLLWRLLLERE